MGSTQYELDFLLRSPLHKDDTAPGGSLELSIPTPDLDENRMPHKRYGRRESSHESSPILYVPECEEKKLAKAIDCLPWGSLSWLIAYEKNVMDIHRVALANTLKITLTLHPQELEERGWNSRFMLNQMANSVTTAIVQTDGDSADTVRIVTDVALLCCSDMSEADLDETKFWKKCVGKTTKSEPLPESTMLDSDSVAALVKNFVLAWSNELHHRLYEMLPFELLVS